MKRLQLFVGLLPFLLVGSAYGQKPIVFKDNVKNPRIIIQGNQGYFVPGDSFELSGNVQIKQMSSDGKRVQMLMTCSKATGKIVKVKEKIEVDNVQMSGGIRFEQSNDSGKVITTGDSAQYDLKENLHQVNVSGEVHVDFGGKSSKDVVSKQGQKQKAEVTSTMNTTSRQATLTFKRKVVNQKDTAELQSAVILGPIVFNGTQLTKLPSGDTEQKVLIKADKMTYDIVGESKHPEVRLEGNLAFHEVDNNNEGATIEGANLLILQLNEEQEITKLQFKSTESGRVNTTITRNSNQKGGK